MKLHIENLNVTLSHQQPPAGLIAALAIAGAAKAAASTNAPEIGETWPGTTAIYAGLALSSDETTLVHLIVWPDEGKDMNYDAAMAFAAGVNPDMNSHAPTRHQGIVLFDRLQEMFNKDYCYWLETKTKSGKAAFVQLFNDGYQHYCYLGYEFRVRAVSEIPL